MRDSRWKLPEEPSSSAGLRLSLSLSQIAEETQSLEQENQELLSQLTQLERDLETSKNELIKSEEKRRQTELTQDSLAEKNKQLHLELQHKQKLQDQLEQKIEERRSKARDYKVALKRQKRRVETLSTHLRRSEAIKTELTEKVKGLLELSRKDRRVFEKNYSELFNRYTALKERFTQQKKSIENLQMKIRDDQKNQIDLARKEEEVHRSNARLRSQLTEAQLEISALQQEQGRKNKRLENEVTRLTNLLESREKALQKQTHLLEQTRPRQAHINQVQRERDYLRVERDCAREELNKAHRYIDRLKANLARQQVEEKQAKNEDISRGLVHLEQMLESTAAQIKSQISEAQKNSSPAYVDQSIEAQFDLFKSYIRRQLGSVSESLTLLRESLHNYHELNRESRSEDKAKLNERMDETHRLVQQKAKSVVEELRSEIQSLKTKTQPPTSSSTRPEENSLSNWTKQQLDFTETIDSKANPKEGIVSSITEDEVDDFEIFRPRKAIF